MRKEIKLKKVKLAGFKSFVDPTTVEIRSNLVAIVGPNGCGKSNIIDAITWVMGESSAKHLRGESLTDVIFNGSTTRKPVGQASVELIFDNANGALGGEYASYAEISIKRAINRDSDSVYYLNNVRCRRRDITDIFSGTGLGPRGYSIIGQNMITRILDAKPDEMRIYLEEAAGISKYKERRRETETRIQHTKDNLMRLNDVQAELEKQLASLQRQANTAERFKELKQQERVHRAQVLAVQWLQLDTKLGNSSLQIRQHETSLEGRLATLSELDQTLERNRNEQQAAQDVFQLVQRRFYEVGNDISRLEQEIQHLQQRKQTLQQDKAQLVGESHEIQRHLAEQNQKTTALLTEQQELNPQIQHAKELVVSAQQALSVAEADMQTWQAHWDEFNKIAAKTTQHAQVEQTRIQHTEQKIAALVITKAKLQQEQVQHDVSKLEAEILTLAQDESELDKLAKTYNDQLTVLRTELTTLHQSQRASAQQLEQVQKELQTLVGQQTSLEALQQTALGQRNSRLLPWLTKNQLDKKPRLAQAIEVEAGWERAVERVLADYLQAICLDEFAEIAEHLPSFNDGMLSVLLDQPPTVVLSTPSPWQPLLSKVKSKLPLAALLNDIYVAETLADALTISQSLSAHQSVITAEGVWVGPSWLLINSEQNSQAGVFEREQALKQLALQVNVLTEQKNTLEHDFNQGRNRVQEAESQREVLQQQATQHYAKLAHVQAQHKSKQERLDEFKLRTAKAVSELAACLQETEIAQADLVLIRRGWQEALSSLEHQAQQRDTLERDRVLCREKVQTARQNATQAQESCHQLEMKLQTVSTQQTVLQQTLTHLNTQLASHEKRKAQLENELVLISSIDGLEKNLNAALAKRLLIEDDLKNARFSVESVNQELVFLESKRQDMENDATRIRTVLESLRLEWQTYNVKAEALLSQVNEHGFVLETILQQLPDNADLDGLSQQLEAITQRINRLGAINLLAIEEYATCAERKDYLDKQYNDLQVGLATLEDAIAKIDKETRSRFKDTFDQVNACFQELFPRIFGGGKAYLELTGDNLLDTGVAVMACPPGKRNSTIHLLSGGEKAMTAIALIFSIFRLNPAPFCLLDEVDAPLDDANIGRFCQLVKFMADKTQFIFISHNKLAIEMGDHLMGVTMHEPGVSRLVSVDIEEAIQLAGL